MEPHGTTEDRLFPHRKKLKLFSKNHNYDSSPEPKKKRDALQLINILITFLLFTRALLLICNIMAAHLPCIETRIVFRLS